HAAVVVHDDDPELQRVRDALEPDGDQGAVLLVEPDHVGQVDVGEGVPGDDEEPVVAQRLLGVLDAAGGAEGDLLGRVAQGHPELPAVAEVVADQRGEELDGDDGLAEPVPLQQPQHVLHDRPVDERQQRLGLVGGHRTQPRPLAARHHDGLHRGVSAPFWSPEGGSAGGPGRPGPSRPDSPGRPGSSPCPAPEAGPAADEPRAATTSCRVCSQYRTAAHQYRPVPQIANDQPTTFAADATAPSWSPSSSSGNAYSRQSVPVLPMKCTGSVPPYPRRRTIGAIGTIASSRATSTATSHSGMMSRIVSPTSVARM